MKSRDVWRFTTAKTLEDAREDMETLREYIHDLAEDARQIQPTDPHEE